MGTAEITAPGSRKRSPPPLQAPAEKPIGRREHKKSEKLKRIKEAAQALFIEHGFDATTMRGIAQCAGVGLGTLFSYASDKRDLLFLIVNDGFEAMAANDRDAVRPELPVLDNLIALFRVHYGFFMQQPPISRFILRELQFYADTPQAQHFQHVRQEMILVVIDIIEAGRRRGEIRRNIEPATAATVLFAIYQAELRHWLGIGEFDLDRGMDRLRACLSVVLDGLRTRRR